MVNIMFHILNQVSFFVKKLTERYFHFFLLGNLLLAGELPGAQSTNFSQNAWTNDLSAGIAPSLHYTHADVHLLIFKETGGNY